MQFQFLFLVKKKEPIFKFDPTFDSSELDDLMHNGVRGVRRHHQDVLRVLAGSLTGGERKEWRPREYVHTRMDVHENRRGKGETQRGMILKYHRGFQSKMSFNLQNETKADQQ